MIDEQTIAPEDIHYTTEIKGNVMEVTSKDPEMAKKVKVLVRLFSEDVVRAMSNVQIKMNTNPEYKAYIDSLVPERFKR